MQQQSYSLVIEAPRQGLHDITAEIADWLTGQPVRSGLLTVFIRHSSASLLIQENWDDDVVADLEAFFTKLVPEESMLYRHIAEGDDDMPAHIKGALTQTQSEHSRAGTAAPARPLSGRLSVRAPPQATTARARSAPDR